MKELETFTRAASELKPNKHYFFENTKESETLPVAATGLENTKISARALSDGREI